MLIESFSQFAMKPVNIVGQLLIANFVALLKFPIIRKILLHGIIGKMYGCKIINQRVLTGRGPDISIPVPISFDVSVDACDHHIMS